MNLCLPHGIARYSNGRARTIRVSRSGRRRSWFPTLSFQERTTSIDTTTTTQAVAQARQRCQRRCHSLPKSGLSALRQGRNARLSCQINVVFPAEREMDMV